MRLAKPSKNYNTTCDSLYSSAYFIGVLRERVFQLYDGGGGGHHYGGRKSDRTEKGLADHHVRPKRKQGSE